MEIFKSVARCTEFVFDKARKSKYSQTSIKQSPIKGSILIWQSAAKIPEKIDSYMLIKTSIRRPPLLSSHGQLLAIPKVILFCFLHLLSGQLSCPAEWLLNRSLTVIYRKMVDFAIMLHLSVKLQLFTKIMISATYSYLSYISPHITGIENKCIHNL